MDLRDRAGAIYLSRVAGLAVKRTVGVLLSVFLLAQLSTILIVGLITVPASAPGEPREPRVHYIEEGDTIQSSVQIYGILMVGVALLALAIKLKLGRIIFRNLEAVLIFLTVFLLLLSIWPDTPYMWIFPAVGVVLLKRRFPHWGLVTALSILLASIVGAIMGVSLGVIPIIALMGFLSVYDVVAVKFSSHMGNVVKLVRGTRSTFLIEIPGMTAAVGISDLAVPSMFVAANLLVNTIGLASLVAVGGAIGLALAIYSSSKNGMVPALPFIFAGTLVAYLVASGF